MKTNGKTTEQSKHALLDRILTSKYFSNADLPKRLLTYLFEKTSRSDSASLTEQEIAAKVLGRPPDFDPRIDPVVRVNVTSVRERLNRYFENEGRQEALRLVIPRGRYRAVFLEADAAFRDRSGDASNWSLQRFWQPYLTSRIQTRVLFTDLLFLTNGRGDVVRNVDCNRPEGALQSLGKRFSGLDLSEYRPAFPYVSAGEVRCLARLMTMFSSLGVGLETSGTRDCSWNILKDEHLILLGSSRTNPFLESMQGSCPFLIQSDHIENTTPEAGEPSSYRRSRDKRGHLDRVSEFALLTRVPSVKEGRVVSMIAANHEKATEGAGDFLTSENDVRHLLEYMGLGEAPELPSFFQVILRVEMLDQGEEVVQTEPVAFRIGEV